jgi:hypothetical protein
MNGIMHKDFGCHIHTNMHAYRCMKKYSKQLHGREDLTPNAHTMQLTGVGEGVDSGGVGEGVGSCNKQVCQRTA